MNPPRYWGMSPYSPTSLPGEFLTLADIYLKRQNFGRAEQLCKQALAISHDLAANECLARVYIEEGKNKEAEQILLNNLDKDESSNRTLEQLANYYEILSRFTESERL